LQLDLDKEESEQGLTVQEQKQVSGDMGDTSEAEEDDSFFSGDDMEPSDDEKVMHVGSV
jgi:hypothetical protein